MLQSAQLQLRQSEIRQKMAKLQTADTLTDEQRNEVRALSGEYQTNESKYQAAMVAEDEERAEAGKALETREQTDWQKLVDGFELRQVALHLDEGAALTGQTAEAVQELRSRGGYRGVPVPYDILEQRTGETIASGIPSPTRVASIIDRLFPQSVAGAMGARIIRIGSGSSEYPVTTSSVSAGWASTETGAVATPTAYTASGNSLAPNNTLGVQMKLTRKSLKQEAGIEDAVRRDLQAAIRAELDKAVFQGSGASGEPSGVIVKASTYGITSTSIAATATYGAFRSATVTFMKASAATGTGSVRVLMRPELFDGMDDAMFDTGSGITEFDRLVSKFGAVVLSANALAAPTGTTPASKALLTTAAGGVSPILVGLWGAVDLIRDPYSDAASGGLRLTGLVTADVTITRANQLQVLTGLQ